jgi:hypothetical protein
MRPLNGHFDFIGHEFSPSSFALLAGKEDVILMPLVKR